MVPSRRFQASGLPICVRQAVAVTVLMALCWPICSIANTEAIGPGVAGQLHALAYDPDATDTIIAGGDVCGVYYSGDNGENWYQWNDGLATEDFTYSQYIDDLLFIPASASVDESWKGIFAATFGGIYFRDEPASWTLSTDYVFDGRLWYVNSDDEAYARAGAPVPFSSLAFDSLSGKLYAGAGHSRRDYEKFDTFYPLPDESDHFSLWVLDLTVPNSDWEPIDPYGQGLGPSNIGIVRDLTVVKYESDGDTLVRVVAATRNGIYAYDPVNGSMEDILTNQVFEPPSGEFEWSKDPWSIAASSNGRVYALVVGDYTDPAPEYPGIYTYNFLSPNDGWIAFAGSDIIYPHNELWYQYITKDELDVTSLTVVPGETYADDEIYVGVAEGTHKGGYFRHGKYTDEGGSPAQSWIHLFYLEDNDDHNYIHGFIHHIVDWLGGPIYDSTEIEVGWLDNHALHPTVPLAVHPQDSRRLFASAYHIPITYVEEGSGDFVWRQRYCTGSDPYWSSNGLNEMTVRDIEFANNGNVVMSGGDFTAFESSNEYGVSYNWLDNRNFGGRNGYDAEILPATELGEQKLFIKQKPTLKYGGTYRYFGFYNNQDEIIHQEKVLAIYDPSRYSYVPNEATGEVRGWKFISQAISDDYESVEHEMADVEVIDGNRVFVACIRDTDPDPNAAVYASRVYEGVRTVDGANETWSWEHWWTSQGRTDCKAVALKRIPGTDKLILAAQRANGGVFSLSLGAPYDETVWFNTEDLIAPYEDLQNAVFYMQCLEVDQHAKTLYVGSSGEYRGSADPARTGTVIRLAIPEDPGVTPALGDWEILANRDESDIPFGFAVPEAWFQHYGTSLFEVNARLTDIQDICIDPQNPYTVFVAMAPKGCNGFGSFHPKQGVWQYSENGSGGIWSQVFGNGIQPSAGATSVNIHPNYDPETGAAQLFIGTWGLEAFKMDIVLSTGPYITSEAFEPLVSGEQSTLSVEITSEGGSLLEVTADATALGGPSDLVLVDNGEGEDLVAGDTIYTSSLIDVPVPAGDYVVPVEAFAAAGNGAINHADVTAAVIDVELVMRLEDKSNDTGEDILERSGPQYCARYFNQSGSDDLLAITADSPVFPSTGEGMLLVEVFQGADRVPEFDDVEDNRLGVSTLLASHRAIASADVNNDGLQDFFVGSSNENENRLYINTGSAFDNQPSGLPAAIGGYDILGATWVDADQDGWLDLFTTEIDMGDETVLQFLMGGSPLVQYDTNIWLNCNKGSGWHPSSPFRVALDGGWVFGHAWFDIDNDGDVDLVAANIGGGTGTTVIENEGYKRSVGDYNFVDVSDTWMPDDEIGRYYSADVAALDYNHDGFLDLALARFGDQSGLVLLENTGTSFAFDATANSSINVYTGNEMWTGVVVADLDLDGWDDILLVPGQEMRPEIYLNFGNDADPQFVEASDLLGIKVGRASGVVWADFNGDGDEDLYLGTDGSGVAEKFFYENRRRGIEPGEPDGDTENNWVKFKIVGNGITNKSAIGARVIIDYGEAGDEDTQTKYVDGGGGRKGQQSRILTFGLGDWSGPVDVTIVWPDGFEESQTGLLSEQVYTIEDTREVTVYDESLRFNYEAFPGGANWVFEWTTDYRSDRRFDKVEFQSDVAGNPGDPCHCGLNRVLNWNDPDVVYSQIPAGLGIRHFLIWTDRCCVAEVECPHRFRVYSGLDEPEPSEWSVWRDFGPFGTCVKEILPPQNP